MMEKLNLCSRVIDKTINETTSAFTELVAEVAQMCKVELPNRQADDYLLPLQGGLCQLIYTECCTFILNNKDLVK